MHITGLGLTEQQKFWPQQGSSDDRGGNKEQEFSPLTWTIHWTIMSPLGLNLCVHLKLPGHPYCLGFACGWLFSACLHLCKVIQVLAELFPLHPSKSNGHNWCKLPALILPAQLPKAQKMHHIKLILWSQSVPVLENTASTAEMSQQSFRIPELLLTLLAMAFACSEVY